MANSLTLTIKDIKAMTVEDMDAGGLEPIEIRLSFYRTPDPACLLEMHFISERLHQVIAGKLPIEEVQRGIWVFSHKKSRRKDGEWHRKFLVHDVVHLTRASDVYGDYVRGGERLEAAHVIIEINDEYKRYEFAAMLRQALRELSED